MKEPSIQSLFPNPVYISHINRKFTEKELDFVNNQKNNCVKNQGNISTNNKYILNEIELKQINKFIKDECQNYLDKVICPKDNIELYVTQSWLNYTKENQYHHQHSHPNSIISGVLYFDCNKNNDKIKFLNTKYQQISPEINDNKFNLWNSTSWWFPVETGQLIMFPSYIDHQVDNKKGTNIRISLAFNTFYKGKLGESVSATELIL
tara:strand:+ start:1350 stop:1970 length:621 start_codon:yes stop_codon:yes gene_type:complete